MDGSMVAVRVTIPGTVQSTTFSPVERKDGAASDARDAAREVAREGAVGVGSC